jgi:hypothetical protein
MNWHKKSLWSGLLLVTLLALALIVSVKVGEKGEKIGVLLVIHGGMDTNTPQHMWNSSVTMFAYDHNHPLYKFVIWNAKNWSAILNTQVTAFARSFLLKYYFEYERIGGIDPYQDITEKQLAAMKAELDKNTYGITFEVDWAGWIIGDRLEHFPYPRFIYNPPSGKGDKVTYCGENEEDGPWTDCDPERFNVDGPVERLLKKGVSRIILVDLTMCGIRFSKTFEAFQMTKKVLNTWNAEHGTSIPLVWINDYSNLMERSFPSEPEGWTRFLGYPTRDRHVLLKGGPNPLAEDPEIAALHVSGIESALSDTVSDAETGVVLMDHALFTHNETFDPKINDTITVQKNIEAQLLERHPKMDPDNIVGAYGGGREVNPENGLFEYTRKERGDRLGTAYLYESDKQMPDNKWGYRYWDALEYLKDRGVKHIVVAFTQLASFSVLDLVEIPNQFGKEIGKKTWVKWGTGDYENYPGVGHPFTDYWGNWVYTDCGGEECCFKMGGCADGRTYPPPRQVPLDKKRDELDPSLAYEVSDYGHLGYDPSLGPPDPNRPVQNQYTGTWDMWTPPNDDPRVGKILAKHVMNAAVNPMVYVTNGERESMMAEESVHWEVRVVTGTPDYSYEWSIKKEGDTNWSTVGKDTSTWVWKPSTEDAGIYDVRCKVTDATGGAGEVVWEDFEVLL